MAVHVSMETTTRFDHNGLVPPLSSPPTPVGAGGAGSDIGMTHSTLNKTHYGVFPTKYVEWSSILKRFAASSASSDGATTSESNDTCTPDMNNGAEGSVVEMAPTIPTTASSTARQQPESNKSFFNEWRTYVLFYFYFIFYFV